MCSWLMESFARIRYAIWLSELELGLEFSDIVQAHSEFFQAIKRKERSSVT